MTETQNFINKMTLLKAHGDGVCNQHRKDFIPQERKKNKPGSGFGFCFPDLRASVLPTMLTVKFHIQIA